MRRAKAERGDEAEPGRELTGSLEAAEVTDLEMEDERRERLDPAEATQPRDRRPVRRLGRKQREPLVECGAAGEQPLDRGQRVKVGELGRDVLEPLRREPTAMRLRPGAAAVVDAPVAKQQLRDAMA
jgi:hypothetical protein